MCESYLTSLVYAHDMVAFIMRHHRLPISVPPRYDRLCTQAQTRFDPAVGELIIYYAKGKCKSYLVETGPTLLLQVTSYEQFEQFAQWFSEVYPVYFADHQNSLWIVELFTIVIELSILLYLRTPNMLDAPAVALTIIVAILKSVRFLSEYGNLSTLNESSKQIMDNPHCNVRYLFTYGTLPW